MKLPIRAFWALQNQIDRLEAERDRRLLRVILCARAGGEPAQGLLEDLNDKVGEPIKVSKAFVLKRTEEDRKGLEELRAMAMGL